MKHSKILSLLALGIVVTIMIYACRKAGDSTSPYVQQGTGMLILTGTVYDKAEQLADLHNDVLDFVTEYDGYDTLNARARMSLVVSATGILADDSVPTTVDTLKYMMTHYTWSSFDTLFTEMVDGGVIDEHELTYLEDARTITEGNGTTADMMDDLDDLENTIYNDNTFATDDEKLRMTAFAAVVKKSLGYWANKSGTTCNDCLSSNKGKIALADGIGGILVGIFTMNPCGGVAFFQIGSNCSQALQNLIFRGTQNYRRAYSQTPGRTRSIPKRGMYVPDHLDPPFRFMLTPHSG